MEATPLCCASLLSSLAFSFLSKELVEVITLAPIFFPGVKTIDLCSHSVQILACKCTHMMQLLTCFGLALCKGGVQVNMAQAVLGDKSVTGRSGVWVLDPASAMGVDLTSILGVVLTSIVGVDLASRVRVVLTSRVGVDLTSTVGVVMTSMVGVDMTSKVGMDLTSTGDGICINSSSWVRSLSTGLLTL